MYKPFSVKELREIKLPESVFIIDGLVPYTGIVCISGQPGCGKSWIMLEMARAVALGEPFFGQFKTQKGAVLIIDEESGHTELKRRINLMGYSDDLDIYFSSRQSIKLDGSHNMNFIFDFAMEIKCKLLIFDPFSAIHDRVENNAEEMQKVFEQMQKFNKAGISIVFLHHHRKESFISRPSPQSLRGSSVIHSRIDSLLMVETEDNGNCLEFTINQAKLRNGPTTKSFTAYLEDSDGKTLVEFGDFIKAKKSKKEEMFESILELVKNKTQIYRDEILSFMKEAGFGERNVSEAIRTLRDKGKLLETKDGQKNYYQISKE